MAWNSPPLSIKEPIVDGKGRPSSSFIDWITAIITDVDTAPSRVALPTSYTDQSASLPLTAIPLPALSTGFYAVQVYRTVTQAATTSSSLSVTVAWTDRGQSKSMTLAALTANLTSAVLTDTLFLRLDASTPVTVQTTHASVGATVMTYDLSVLVSQVSA